MKLRLDISRHHVKLWVGYSTDDLKAAFQSFNQVVTEADMSFAMLLNKTMIDHTPMPCRNEGSIPHHVASQILALIWAMPLRKKLKFRFVVVHGTWISTRPPAFRGKNPTRVFSWSPGDQDTREQQYGSEQSLREGEEGTALTDADLLIFSGEILHRFLLMAALPRAP